jgi:16S rRNA (cytidine1402-2'-O)-methyltransferase
MKGEFVIVVAGAAVDHAGSVDADTLLKELVAVLPGKQAAAIVARVTGESRNAVYQRMLELKERQ